LQDALQFWGLFLKKIVSSYTMGKKKENGLLHVLILEQTWLILHSKLLTKQSHTEGLTSL
jgi:hypothetical protein